VHLSEKAIEPPGEARADLDIFLDYADRMGFTDKDGDPLVWWTNAEEAFEAFKLITAGRPADYSGMSYDLLREREWLQWPCSPSAPEGTQRLYTDGNFWTWTDQTEDFGHDLLTGATREEAEHRALRADGRAMLLPAEWVPPVETVSDEFPLRLATGRTVHHFHTRTKTARAPELQAAAPDVWVELHEDDARALGIAEGDRCRVVSPRGQIEAVARLGRPRAGQVFVPFHYGYWDRGADAPDGEGSRAANEMTITAWDPVSKQPLFKSAAVRVEKVG
jgi:anaerobic selenocysteine-containing dehydrogenase